jgi:hypothetical protein
MITFKKNYSRSWHNLELAQFGDLQTKNIEGIKSFYFKMPCIKTKSKFGKIKRNEFQLQK